MSNPGEHKTVQARILKYAQGIGGPTCRRGFDFTGATPEDRKASLFSVICCTGSWWRGFASTPSTCRKLTSFTAKDAR